MPKARRPQPGLAPWEQQSDLVWRFLCEYLEHRPFTDRLLSVYDAHCARQPHFRKLLRSYPNVWELRELSQGAPNPQTAAAVAYMDSVRSLVEDFGLDKLRWTDWGPIERGDDWWWSRGADLIHFWCWLTAHDNDSPLNVRTILLGASVGESTGEATEDPTRDVSISVAGEWDPTEKTPAQVREELLQAATERIDGELERIARGAEMAGYAFPDTTPKVTLHTRWLFERVALQRSCSDIASKHLDGWWQGPRVYNAIRPLAAKIGVVLTATAKT